MMEARPTVNIELSHIEENLRLNIDCRVDKTLFFVDDAAENGEAEYRLVEGFYYDYEFSNPAFELEKSLLVQPHSRKRHLGTIAPNIFVGTLSLPVLKDGKEVGVVQLEVRSVKADYRKDYRDMLELITEKCTDLLLQANSPVSHNFETDFERDSRTLYQRFVFVKSVISTDEFSESVHRIVSMPVTQWKEASEEKDVRNIRRFRNANIRELVSGSNRTALASHHYLAKRGLTSIPGKIKSARKTDTVDTPENRFVKFALESFWRFCSDIHKKAGAGSRLYREADMLEKELESYLSHSVFREISNPDTLRLNSPVLQRKEGYREILRVWLMFDLAAKLVWKGGEDVYSGGKKNIAALYEYWLFFKLLDLFRDVFSIEPKDISDLIKETDDGLGLQLKQGRHTALSGIYNAGSRELNIRFNYNRSFGGGKDYPSPGSWTTAMRPDYTLSFWPWGISEKNAEAEELIVHIHFDAKYKVANIKELLNGGSETADLEEDLSLEKEEHQKGIYKNADLLKMHAYKDAIRRTGGAYVLYPGGEPLTKKGFHEIIPGLGAFPVRPAKDDDGIADLKDFILDVINHFQNRASQRERAAFRSYDVYKNVPDRENDLNDSLPELLGENRGLIPDDTFVLVGYYKNDNFDWIIRSGLYNARADSNRGSLRLGPGEAGAKFLLLHTSGETKTNKLFRIIETGPRVFSKQTIIAKGYPSEPTQDYYLVYKVQSITDGEFRNHKWDITQLEKFKTGRGSGLPFSVTLKDLMKAKIRTNE